MFKSVAGFAGRIALIFLLIRAVPAVAAAAPQRAAVFPFELQDTGPVGVQPADQARLARLDAQLAKDLAASGEYVPVDIGNIASRLAGNSLHDCPSCATELARAAGAQVEVNGWVQKVSNLILNISLVVRDAKTGAVLHAGSVDMRGDTDESWRRALAYLLKYRILTSDQAATR